MPSLEEQIRSQARELLAAGQVTCVIGYEQGSRGQVRPAFVYRPEEVERLVWNTGCTHNLVTYLHAKRQPAKKGEPPPHVAIVVKPCDSRALNVLLGENQVERARVHIIGVACEGIAAGAGFAPGAAPAAGATAGLQSRCVRCVDRKPAVFDTLIGEPPAVTAVDEALDLERIDRLSPQERAAFWLSQYDRCIRCYACRQACPACYCSVCMFERDDSLWIGMRTNLKEKEFFHLGRAYHLAARCVGCNECERVCPMQLPLSLLNRKLAKEVQSLLSYQAGREAVQAPLLTMLAEGEESPL